MRELRYPTPDELYALELAARRARSEEMARLTKAFWQSAARSLHPSIRRRHLADIELAERVELALDAAIEVWSRARAALGKAFQTAPRRASHEHR